MSILSCLSSGTFHMNRSPKTMMGKKLGSFKKLAKMVKVYRTTDREPWHHDHLLKTYGEEGCTEANTTTPRGFFAIYVGEEPRRFVVPTAHLSHPLFKMLLEKAYDDEDQNNRLVVPCSVAAFEKVVKTVECCNGMVDIEHLVEEFI
ncbi:putative small auxin-up RNA [Helianthus anomalus]